MPKFTLELTETLSRTISIEASSPEEAYDIARQKYHNEEIVLDSSDYVDTEIKVKEQRYEI